MIFHDRQIVLAAEGRTRADGIANLMATCQRETGTIGDQRECLSEIRFGNSLSCKEL